MEMGNVRNMCAGEAIRRAREWRKQLINKSGKWNNININNNKNDDNDKMQEKKLL